MIGTLAPQKKSAWKDHISTSVFAYNCTRHDTTGVSPYFLIFGHEPQLPVDIEYDIKPADGGAETYAEYVKQLRKKMQEAYELAAKNSKVAQGDQKKIFDIKVHGGNIQVGDLVLVRKKDVHFMDKLADKLEEPVYAVVQRPYVDLPLFMVKPQAGGRIRPLHRNMLLPLGRQDNATDVVHRQGRSQRTRSVNVPDDVAEESSTGTESEDDGDAVIMVPLANNQLGQNTAGTAPRTPSSHEPGDDQSNSDHEEHDMAHGDTRPLTEQLEQDHVDTTQPEPGFEGPNEVQLEHVPEPNEASEEDQVLTAVDCNCNRRSERHGVW